MFSLSLLNDIVESAFNVDLKGNLFSSLLKKNFTIKKDGINQPITKKIIRKKLKTKTSSIHPRER